MACPSTRFSQNKYIILKQNTDVINTGMPLQCLQELLGHKSIEMTRRYARLTDNTRREAYYKAMAIIEAGEINGHYRLDYQLP